MINTFNHQFLTGKERLAILERARFTQPYFNILNFDLAAEIVKRPQYSSKAEVNKDFWLTEIQGNFGEVFELTGSLFDVSVYSQLQNRSLYRFIQGEQIPSAFVMTEARFNAPLANQLFDDKQFEYMPRKILHGDKIVANIKNLSVKAETATARIVLKGYYEQSKEYLTTQSLRGINETLAQDIQFEEWRFKVNHNGIKNYKFSNDRKARLVLGFAAIDIGENINRNSTSLMTIFDNFRELQWNNLPIPVEFFAPRLPVVRDTKFYYLPIEYFFEPFATLQFKIDNTLNEGDGYEFIMLTRTI